MCSRPTVPLSLRQLSWATLARQRLLARARLPLVAAVRGLVALQGRNWRRRTWLCGVAFPVPIRPSSQHDRLERIPSLTRQRVRSPLGAVHTVDSRERQVNRDGEDHDRSWKRGVEGEPDAPEVLRLRARQPRNFLATLLLSQGVSMLSGGDDLGCAHVDGPLRVLGQRY